MLLRVLVKAVEDRRSKLASKRSSVFFTVELLIEVGVAP
jgi:hypothetical protein